ncbi:MAG: hypothetical protein AAF688_00990 [Bacteroidota bacterium]
MRKQFLLLLTFFTACQLFAQNPSTTTDSASVENDSLNKRKFLKQLGNGYFPTKFLDIDLRYLIKFNQYEGIRTGLGGVTNDAFSEKYRINSYLVYGFRDDQFKYRIGGGARLDEKTETWLNLSYTDDLTETGSSSFLTDKRFFSFFEPRLLNIDLFHRHITRAVNLEHKISDNLLSELELAVSDVSTTYDYIFRVDGRDFVNWDLSTAKLSFQWSPFNKNEFKKDGVIETTEGFPKFTLQLTQSFRDVLKGDFNFFKADFRTIQRFNHLGDSFSLAVLRTGIAKGNTPLAHLYHAYPNNIRKETILQRFSVAGINSFETMFFNEFFSDRFATLQLKHYFKSFNISKRFNPQLVLISRFALGDMQNIERHQNINFKTLDKVYSEAGLEINKLLFGFGLSFAYRYGGYHLPNWEDNIAFKFTFNITL